MTGRGVRLRTVLARWFGTRTMELFVDPVLADLQAEYKTALEGGARWRARWIWIAGHVALARVVVWVGGRRMLQHGHRIEAATQTMPRPPMISALLVASATTALLAAAPFVRMNAADTGHGPALLLLLVPQALPIAMPVGVVVGVLQWARRRQVSLRGLRPVAATALACSIGSFIVLARVAPDANQAFREAIFRPQVARDGSALAFGSIPRGVNELTLGQLRDLITSDAPAMAWPADRRTLAFAYHGRWANAAASLVLSMFAFAVAARWRNRRPRMVLAAIAGLLAYVSLLPDVGRVLFGALPGLAAWTPNAGLLLAALAAWKAPPRRPEPRPSHG